MAMEQDKFPRIRVQGPPLDRGRQYGEGAASQIKRNIDIYKEMFAYYAGWDWEKTKSHARLFEPVISAYRSRHLDEMRGIAEGAKVDYEDILALNVRTEIRNFAIAKRVPRECTSFVILPPIAEVGHTLIGQNWDWAVPVQDTVIVLEVDAGDVPNFVTLVEAGLLAKTGMNANGIGMTTNSLYSNLDIDASVGVPHHIILRTILESESYSDAIQAINGHIRASSANFTVAHRDGEFFNIEAAPGDFTKAIIHFPEEDYYAHTNHFITKDTDFIDMGIWHGPGSLVRNQRINRFLRTHQGKFSVSDLQNALADHFNFPNSVCGHPDPRDPVQEHYKTVASIIMDLKEATIWLAAGNPCDKKYEKYAFQKLLES